MIIIRLLLFYFTLSCFVSGSDLLSIGFWNIENLFDLENDPTKRDDEFAIGGKKNVTSDIYDLKIKRSVEVLTDLNVDIIGLCEVENISVLNDLNNSYKDRDYKIIHFDSPDERGIDNALLYDQNKFSYEIIDPGEHKKFEYYTNYAFAVTANGTQILSGGRYDNLCKELGGEDVYASGFAININEIVQLNSSGQ